MAHPVKRPLDPALTQAIGDLVEAINHIEANPISRSRFDRQTRLVRFFLLQMQTQRRGLAIPQDVHQELEQYRTQTAQLRQKALHLSENERAAFIPAGPYCYRVIRMVSPPEAGHTIAPYPFLMGARPETMCVLNPQPWWNDLTYHPDACKGCGINESEVETRDADDTPQ